jgi:hypothetical protein
MRRRMVLLHMIVIGIVVQAVSYFLLATPWGFPPADVGHSNPRLLFAPVFFITGMVLLFLGVLLYEILPDQQSDDVPQQEPRTLV